MKNLKCGGINKFIVFKREDVAKYTGNLTWNVLLNSAELIENGRERDGKKRSNEYIVINTDEPYANEVIEILKKHGHWG